MSTPQSSRPRGGEKAVHDADFDVSDWSKDIDPPVEPLTREEAQALIAKHPSMSVWQVLAAQTLFGVLVALLWGGLSRDVSALWSSLYATAVVEVPGLLMARGVFGRNAFLVFVDYQHCEPDQRPDFFVLSGKDWRRVVLKRVADERVRNPRKRITITPQNTSIFEDHIGRSGRAYEGIGIRPSDVAKYQGRWDKIVGA